MLIKLGFIWMDVKIRIRNQTIKKETSLVSLSHHEERFAVPVIPWMVEKLFLELTKGI